MDARLLAQLAMVFDREAEAHLPDPYAISPEPPASPEAAEEAARLRAIGDAIFRRAKRKGFGKGPGGSGTDAAFGYLVEVYLRPARK